MTWIKTIPIEDAKGALRQQYDLVSGPQGDVDNILQLHSLRPHTLRGHMMLYKNVLHHRANTLPKWFLETVGIFVSHLNCCEYCVEHHFAGLRKLLKNDERAEAIRTAVEVGDFDETFSPMESAALAYARDLTLVPADADHTWITRLRGAGLSDGEVLEVNQVVAYFAYANRTVLGLGGSLEGDILGLSPHASDEADWHHR